MRRRRSLRGKLTRPRSPSFCDIIILQSDTRRVTLSILRGLSLQVTVATLLIVYIKGQYHQDLITLSIIIFLVGGFSVILLPSMPSFS